MTEIGKSLPFLLSKKVVITEVSQSLETKGFEGCDHCFLKNFLPFILFLDKVGGFTTQKENSSLLFSP